tara:strand:- start:12787 stop:13854 length:1068 start_codon:yes stop_codon:yes gene_type:complete
MLLIASLNLLAMLFITPGASAQCNDINAQFSVSQNSLCGAGPFNVAINNQSNGPASGGADYEWLLNGVTFDNTSGTGNPNDAVLPGPGTYTIEMIVTGNGPPCTESVTETVTVFPQPTADFVFAPDNDCAGVDVNFINQSTNTVTGTAYDWDFGDGNNSNQENPTHVFGAGGTYTVTLTVQNAPGCTSTFSQTVTVLDIPNVSIIGDDGDGNTTNCLLPGDPTTSQTVDFFNGTTGAVSYFWDFGDGNTSTDFEPSHLYTTYGTFQVTMTATGPNGCTATETIEVVFERFVSASMSLSAVEYSGCAPHELTTLTNGSTMPINIYGILVMAQRLTLQLLLLHRIINTLMPELIRSH